MYINNIVLIVLLGVTLCFSTRIETQKSLISSSDSVDCYYVDTAIYVNPQTQYLICYEDSIIGPSVYNTSIVFQTLDNDNYFNVDFGYYIPDQTNTTCGTDDDIKSFVTYSQQLWPTINYVNPGIDVPAGFVPGIIVDCYVKYDQCQLGITGTVCVNL
ncbi:hypothetical protein DLAC_02627 [Tieghemostelium lacteum]|uniref:Transmembrane protein n=1 Tax=Tieghemostelium lacteum TaxID=361077 RepID=A0A152A321_TIELA|nr:hypothetical protein DLAC_02627 [Tieghemostelium lacteum]|eukprot:KYR00604.1 hypothetical protein DLAC_02627 [Tieghemostelium lacteum]